MSTSDSRIWFITGSSQGLGRALLEEVLASGERAVATLRKPTVLAPLVEKYASSQLLVVPLDVTDEAQIVAAFEATKKHFGRLDVVVNNAGYGLEGEIEDTPEAEARKQIEVLFWGPVRITKEAIKFLRDVNPPGYGGRVLNISSVGGYSSNPTLAFYSAGKFALEAFTEAFTKEMLPEWNIKGLIIEPGGFETEWGGSSMIHVPIHPRYQGPTSPGLAFRKMREASHQYGGGGIGDPNKGGKVLMQIASMPNPPLRIQLGTDSLMLVRNKALKTVRDGETFEEISHSTNKDGIDKDQILGMIKEANV
ncbi:hypothetical protein BKA93DRAFT_738065 [Sparassis latifolia]|uniref:Uncharacterized oxidoreductase n=1 Tax=Sparassis crispa TaxID=139825 RepID=A0A401GI43_9APHY|nr:Uncharacterized oxidoreductase [Sparassis crispa]GBE81793.1 Uncharacterized oxidoreductase [Sparassis crispa]